jgi:endonuclease III
MKTQEKALEIIRRLKKAYPDPKTALNFNSPFNLLVATILSAQATDILVNKVTPALFRKYRSVKDYADTPLEVLQKDVTSINFYKTKAKNIRASAQIIMENFQGKVPKTMEELVTLPGVARKTANIILSNAYGINAGIAVDTHVKRLAYRLGLTKNGDPVKIEKELMAITPKEDWSHLSHLLIFHGRKVCHAKNPKHDECILSDICPSKDI